MITISMLQRDVFGRVTDKRVEHSSTQGHSVSAFFMRGGYKHNEFEKMPATAATRILTVQRGEYEAKEESEG